MNTYSNRIMKKLDSSQSNSRVNFNARTIEYNIGDIRVFPVVLDMDTVEVIRTPIRFKQYDYGTCFISFKLVEDDVSIILNNVSIVAYFKNSNHDLVVGGGYNLKSQGVVLSSIDGVIKVEVPKGVLLFPGEIECEILLFDSEHNRSTSPRVVFSIEESLVSHEDDTGFTDDLRYSLLTDLMNNVNTLHYNTESLISENKVLHDDIKSNEIVRCKQEDNRQTSMSDMVSIFNSKVDIVDNKVNEINTVIAAGTQDLEVKQARISQDGTEYDCLNSRLIAIENSPYVYFADVEG